MKNFYKQFLFFFSLHFCVFFFLYFAHDSLPQFDNRLKLGLWRIAIHLPRMDFDVCVYGVYYVLFVI